MFFKKIIFLKNGDLENKIKLRKIVKLNKKAKLEQTKPYYSNSFKQTGSFYSSINKYNSNISNLKKNENNNSNILNSQKKKQIPNIKNSNGKQIQLPLNKKLNIIEESTENQKKVIII